MTHQQGGGIPHAWLLTKHEMFMLSVYGRVCGCARWRKTRDKVDSDPHVVPPTVSCILASPCGRECHPLTKDVVIEQDKTLTFHQHLSFSLSLSLLPSDTALAFALTGGVHKLEAQRVSRERTK